MAHQDQEVIMSLSQRSVLWGSQLGWK